MPKKIIITTLIVLITIMFPVNLKASLIPKEISQNYIIYEDASVFPALFFIVLVRWTDLFLETDRSFDNGELRK